MRWWIALLLPIVVGAACLDDLVVEEFDLPGYAFYGRGEALYWRSVGGGFDFATPVNGETKPDTLRPTNHFGWRVALGMMAPNSCWFGEISALQLRAQDVRNNNARLGPYIPPFGLTEVPRVQARLLFDYWNVQWMVGRPVCQGESAEFHLLGVARFADIRERRAVRGQDFRSENQQLRDEEGQLQVNLDGSGRSRDLQQTITVQEAVDWMRLTTLGPGLGVGGNFVLCDGIQVGGHLLGFGLAGWRQQYTMNGLCPRAHAVVPALDVRLALSYWQEIDQMLFKAEIGYELQHYSRALRPVIPYSTVRASQDVGFSGPFASLRVTF